MFIHTANLYFKLEIFIVIVDKITQVFIQIKWLLQGKKLFVYLANKRSLEAMQDLSSRIISTKITDWLKRIAIVIFVIPCRIWPYVLYVIEYNVYSVISIRFTTKSRKQQYEMELNTYN
jgi:hypothetical protein